MVAQILKIFHFLAKVVNVLEVQYTSAGERKWNAAISVSFGKYLNLTVPFFGQLVAQSLLKLLLLPILNKSLKDYLQLFELLLSR